MAGIGRNDPCWCGSGKKYKRCHLDRDREAPVQLWELDRGMRHHYGAKHCMVPDAMKESCSGHIVRAHTVPKSGSLQRIAADGHVYATISGVQQIDRHKGLIIPELVGVNNASTFTGFCAHHDKQLFAPIEDAPMEFTPQQCFLLGYRAMARENFLKRAQLGSMELLRSVDKGRSLAEQIALQRFASIVDTGVTAGAGDAERQKKLYDATLLSGDFSTVRAYVITFDQLPSVMCSGGIFPHECFDGTIAQDLGNLSKPTQAIFFTSFAGGELGAVVFTWLPDSDRACGHFIKTLQAVEDKDLSNALIRFFFEFCENLQIAPAWWLNLPSPTRDALVRRHTDAANVTVERSNDCLLDDGLLLADWGVRERYIVGPTGASM